jgi:hypothetical protein
MKAKCGCIQWEDLTNYGAKCQILSTFYTPQINKIRTLETFHLLSLSMVADKRVRYIPGTNNR